MPTTCRIRGDDEGVGSRSSGAGNETYGDLMILDPSSVILSSLLIVLNRTSS